MADITATIETLENRWMRAWAHRDLKVVKSLTSRDFRFLLGSKPPVILDRPSWIEAAAKRYACHSYRFGDVVVRDLGTSAVFSAALDLEASIDGKEMTSSLWVTDLWRRGRVRRGWKLAQRVVSRADDDAQLRSAIKSMQLWK